MELRVPLGVHEACTPSGITKRERLHNERKNENSYAPCNSVNVAVVFGCCGDFIRGDFRFNSGGDGVSSKQYPNYCRDY